MIVRINNTGFNKYNFNNGIDNWDTNFYDPKIRNTDIFKVFLNGSSRPLKLVLGTYVAPKSTSNGVALNKHINIVGINKMNTYNPRGYINAFIKDAKVFHGLTLNPGTIHTTFKTLDYGTIAQVWNKDKAGVYMEIDPDQWASASRIKKWYIIYHELGHDILNLSHNTAGPMMNTSDAGKSFTYSEFYRDKKTMFNYYKNN